MPIVNVLLWAVLLGAAWVGYQLINFYNQAEEEANRKIASCYRRDRQQRVSQYDIRIDRLPVLETVGSMHSNGFMIIGDNTFCGAELSVEFRIPSHELNPAIDDQNEMSADADCQSCA